MAISSFVYRCLIDDNPFTFPRVLLFYFVIFLRYAEQWAAQRDPQRVTTNQWTLIISFFLFYLISLVVQYGSLRVKLCNCYSLSFPSIQWTKSTSTLYNKFSPWKQNINKPKKKKEKYSPSYKYIEINCFVYFYIKKRKNNATVMDLWKIANRTLACQPVNWHFVAIGLHVYTQQQPNLFFR